MKSPKMGQQTEPCLGVLPLFSRAGPKGNSHLQGGNRPGEDNIDVLPLGWLHQRGCNFLMAGDGPQLQTPKSSISVHMWGGLPYITKEDCKRLFKELPNKDAPGRDGRQAVAITCSARVARAIPETTEALRERLAHLQDEIGPKGIHKMITKYKCIPDQYHDKPEDIITPTGFDSLVANRLEVDDGGSGCDMTCPFDVDSTPLYGLWEWCAGSAALSATARVAGVQHLPPVDYRFGWSLRRFGDQIRLLFGLLFLGTQMLFIAPNCSPWGNNSRALAPSARTAARQDELTMLTFVALCCFLQELLGRRYLLENPAGSDIFDSEESPLKHLRRATFHVQYVDQCRFGANLEGHYIKKGHRAPPQVYRSHVVATQFPFASVSL